MESRSIFTSVGELDQLHEFARGTELEVVQLSPGQMHGVLAHVDLGASSLHLNRLSLPARGLGAVSADRWTFVIFPVGVRGCFNLEPLTSDIMLVYPPGSEFEGTISSGFHDWVFTASIEDLTYACSSLFQRDVTFAFRAFRSVHPDPQAIQHLRDFASRTLDHVQQSPDLLRDLQTRRCLHTRLLRLLTATLLSASPSARQPRGKLISRWEIVRRAEDVLRSLAHEQISLTELCARTETSERSLRRAFQDVVGLSPQAYLRTIRLNRARAELEQSSPNTRTVASIAMRWGFLHLGRFSHDYRNFFGEFPSETMDRNLLWNTGSE